jgi:hypothetical protein
MRFFVFFVIFVTQSDGMSVSDTIESDHRIEKRGLFAPWLLYGMNAATGEEEPLSFSEFSR